MGARFSNNGLRWRACHAALAVVLAAVAAAGLGLAAASARAATPPQDDPFYTAPPGFASTAPGTILRSRQVTVKLGPVPVTGLAFTAYQLLYRTNDATDHPVANVTTVIVPREMAPAGGRRLVSVQDAEDSVDPDCAPSYQLQEGQTAPNGDSNGNLAAETSLVMTELARGDDVVIPDAEGPDSEYIVTGMEAHATLDSIRAVEQFARPPASLEPRRPSRWSGTPAERPTRPPPTRPSRRTRRS